MESWHLAVIFGVLGTGCLHCCWLIFLILRDEDRRDRLAAAQKPKGQALIYGKTKEELPAVRVAWKIFRDKSPGLLIEATECLESLYPLILELMHTHGTCRMVLEPPSLPFCIQTSSYGQTPTHSFALGRKKHLVGIGPKKTLI